MDAHEVWQENKRWILGVALGVMVFWVADLVIASTFDTAALNRKISSVRRELTGTDFYSRDAKRAAEVERDELATARQRLEQALVFVPTDEFVVAGKGDPDLHFDQVSRRVKRDLTRRAATLGIDLAEKNLEWGAPVGEEIAPTLVALCLLEQAATRLMDAHERVREWSPDALGLVAIETLKVNRGSRTAARRGRRSASHASDVLNEETVQFRFRADDATTTLFLEQCLSQAPRLVLTTDFEMTTGRAPGDPLTVSGTLAALLLP